ncbi:RNA-directed DNA polymerase (Reverse transcriptase), partial [Trifolium medium]|nr:RNA-directed DNA polymerase (Reverse transcriptase) [Trifolium medium]
MLGCQGFIEDLDMIDLLLLGHRFTWYNSNGRSMSRIDRVLVSPEWLELWGAYGWREQEVTGWMGFVLKGKLRGLKVRLKEWNKVEFGNVEGRMKKLVEDIQDLDVRGEIMGLAPHEVNLRKALFEEFWKLQKFKEASIVQRSRSKWLSQGDANSKFFH